MGGRPSCIVISSEVEKSSLQSDKRLGDKETKRLEDWEMSNIRRQILFARSIFRLFNMREANPVSLRSSAPSGGRG